MTTEERAEKYAMTYTKNLQKTAFRAFGEGYSEGVADQKKIVIDKAWKFIEFIAEYTGLDMFDLEQEYKKAMED